MKLKIFYKTLIAISMIAMVIYTACTKDTANVTLDTKLTTSQVLKVTSDSATVVGFVIATGSGISERGICYSATDTAPTTSSSKVIYSGEVKGATYSVVLAGLQYATKYYARAYAITPDGAVYSPSYNFTTLPVIPTVLTGQFVATTGVSASGGGKVTNNGGAAVTARGVCYDTIPNPTLSGPHTSDGVDTGSFTSFIKNLSGQTKYHVRAYAKNSAGIGYGADSTFTTPLAIVTLWAAGQFQGWNPGAATDSFMNSLANPIAEGYLYLPSTEGFKFVSQKNWNGPNYGAGSADGKLSSAGSAGNLSVSAPGYYLFKLDIVNMTYTSLLTTWGVIGDATAGSWNSDQAMTYSIVTKQWFATIPLTTGSIKFRANGNWNLNYGGANGKLNAGGDNISIANANTYTVALNLSSPLNYKYSVNTWGLIGSATANSWNSDTQMTPHSDNTWTYTGALTAGEIKFRANGNWNVNFGGKNGSLILGGDNISIPSDGNYTITLDLFNNSYTIQQN
jgi:hypothetical protein